MIVAAAMIVFVWSFAVIPLMEISHEMNSPLNFIEPFIAVLNSRVLCLVTPAMYIFLISDYPHLDRGSLFVLHRVNKREWALGQFIFFTFSAFAFSAIIFMASLIPNCMNSFAANGWSLVVTKYGVYNPERAHSFAASLIKEELYNQIAPYQAALTSFFLNFLYMLTLAMILRVESTENRRSCIDQYYCGGKCSWHIKFIRNVVFPNGTYYDTSSLHKTSERADNGIESFIYIFRSIYSCPAYIKSDKGKTYEFPEY